MIAVGQRDEATLGGVSNVAPVVEAHLHRNFHGGGAIVGIEAAGESPRRDSHQSFRQVNDGLVCESGEDHLLETSELCGDGRVDPSVGVAEQVDPPGADRVQVALAGKVLEPHALPAANGNERQLSLVVLHLGARVPHVRQIASDVGVVHRGHEKDCGMIRRSCRPRRSTP